MPLSDHEQRLLEQMERALYQEDPKFASSLRSGRNGTVDRKRVVVGALGVVVGLVVVVAAVATSLVPVGVVGFALMVAGAFWALNATRGKEQGESSEAAPEEGAGPLPPTDAGPKRSSGQSAFMSRMEERWRRRREGDGRG